MISILLAITPWLTSVYEYKPAPGQFINEVPEVEAGASYSEVLEAVKEQICGAQMPGLISLGSFGGYVTVGFDHPVVNVDGEDDFAIYGNAINNGAEPGIVMVSVDSNRNGVPDDEWYELDGCFGPEDGIKENYSITYYRPEEGKATVHHPDWKFVSDAEYIRWEDSEGESGYVMQIVSHEQSYWPCWTEESTLTFSGTRLPDIATSETPNGMQWKVETPSWGYADSQPNNQGCRFDIGKAIDKDRQPVYLPQADFIRVYTGTHQFRGWLGESSTEIAGGEDLHPEAKSNSSERIRSSLSTIKLQGRELHITAIRPTNYVVADLQGKAIRAGKVAEGDNIITLEGVAEGIYLVKCEKVVKFAL